MASLEGDHLPNIERGRIPHARLQQSFQGCQNLSESGVWVGPSERQHVLSSYADEHPAA